jgi:hypothetical protein
MTIQEAAEIYSFMDVGYGQPYPNQVDYERFPGYVIVASLDAGKDFAAPLLEIYTTHDFMAMAIDIAEMIAEVDQ